MKLEHLKIEAGYRGRPGGHPGGQQCGGPTAAVHITHLPTGLKAECDCERSQLKNKNVCLAMIEYGLAEIGWADATESAS